MKKIIPIKLVFSNDGNGNIVSAVFLYKICVNGQTGPNVFSIDVQSAITNESILSLFNTAVAQAIQSEGIQ